MPELHHALMRLYEVFGTPNFNSIVPEVWQHLTTQTIDYGIMEKAKNVVVIPAEGLEWFDVGSWESLFDVFPTDENGNILQAPLHQAIDTHHTLVFSTQDNRMIATLGINNLIIVDTADALFICKKDQAQQVRLIVEKIKNSSFE
jgi:mannose-1-phosphate guanylyltransferase